MGFTRTYTVIYERAADGGWGAYAPDLPGLGVAAETQEEVKFLFEMESRFTLTNFSKMAFQFRNPPPSPHASESK